MTPVNYTSSVNSINSNVTNNTKCAKMGRCVHKVIECNCYTATGATIGMCVGFTIGAIKTYFLIYPMEYVERKIASGNSSTQLEPVLSENEVIKITLAYMLPLMIAGTISGALLTKSVIRCCNSVINHCKVKCIPIKETPTNDLESNSINDLENNLNENEIEKLV